MGGAEADFTCFSFQADKHITIGAGGMLVIRRPNAEGLVAKAKRLRWFGIDRKAKWSRSGANDVWGRGYKYQMTDIAASMDIAGLASREDVIGTRARFKQMYCAGLKNVPGIELLNETSGNSHWLMTVLVENRDALIRHLRDRGVQSDLVQYRNDPFGSVD